MFMKLSDAIMEETFSKFDEENDPILYRVYGVVTASTVKRLLLGSLSAFSNQYFLVGFSKTRMIMIRLDMLGKPKEPAVIHLLDIQDVKISGWMLGMGKEIYIQLTDGSKIRLKVNKKNVMLKKQTENLEAICDLLSESRLG
jgi:hypothetical protein